MKKMRILYIFLDGTRSQGVIRKVKSKIRILNELGFDTTGIFLNRSITSYETVPAERITYVPLKVKPLSSLFNRRFLREVKWYFAAKRAQKELYRTLDREVHKQEFDLLLFRYPLANAGLLHFMRKHRSGVVFEHNSKELVEMELGSLDNPAMRYAMRCEQRYGPRVLSLAAGLIGVGKEVTAYEKDRSGRSDIPTEVVANGMDVESVRLRSIPEFDGRRLNLLFVTGSPSSWVGVDLLLRGLKAYTGPLEFHVDIVGRKEPELETLAKELGVSGQVTFAGEKYGAELDACFDSSHIAIGTLAMHRVGLSEHSSLKVVEYASRGIPFVIAYEDTNFSAVDDFAPYYLQTSSGDEGLDMSRVAGFAARVLADREHAAKMRSLALAHLDFRVKMDRLGKFLQKLNDAR